MYPGSRQGTVHLSNPVANGHRRLENWRATLSTTSPSSLLQVRDGGNQFTPTSMSFPTITISSGSSNSNVGHTRTHVAVIAGTLAGVVVLLAILLTVFIVRRRQRQPRIKPILPEYPTSSDTHFVPHPFAHNPVLSHNQQYDPPSPSRTGSEVPQLSHDGLGYPSPSHRGGFPDLPGTLSAGFTPRSPYAETEMPYPQPAPMDVPYAYPSPPQSYNPNLSISSSPSQSHGISLSFSSTTSPPPTTGYQRVNTSQYTDDSKTTLLNTTSDIMPPSPQYSPSLFPSPFPPPSSHVPQSQASIALVSGIPPPQSRRDSPIIYPPSSHSDLGSLTARARAAVTHTSPKSRPPLTSPLPAPPVTDDQTTNAALPEEADIPSFLAQAPCLAGVPHNERTSAAQAMQSMMAKLKEAEEQDPGCAAVVDLQRQIDALRREDEELRMADGHDAPPAYM